ncbi:hypothetical protein MHU86_1011 [Fragilaria crotonensis]|nr:hypothetical protein MHU86_1011 [Fragilaria crotonensis]
MGFGKAILIKPPLPDCWTKTASPSLPQSSDAIVNASGDELEALEAIEELCSHLRNLDMAVYNKSFNPIKSEGTNGARKDLAGRSLPAGRSLQTLATGSRPRLIYLTVAALAAIGRRPRPRPGCGQPMSFIGM